MNEEEITEGLNERRGSPLMDNVITWNIRGLNSPNKQEEIKIFLEHQIVGLVAFLETKVKRKNIAEVGHKLFGRWNWYINVYYNPKVRIWVAWQGKSYHV